MTFSRQPSRISMALCLFIALAIVFVVSTDTKAGDPRVIVRVGDTTALPGQANTVISVYMDNFTDIVDGFDLTLHVGNTDLMEFKVDTIQELYTRYWVCNIGSVGSCTDSSEVDSTQTYEYTTAELIDVVVGNVDTTGTLLSGWEYLKVQSTSGFGNTMRITAQADQAAAPVTPGINPQQGGVLIKLLADVPNIDDTVSNRTSSINIQRDFSDQLLFSTNLGNEVIGLYTYDYVDTNFYVCTDWIFDSCVTWKRTNDPPWDWFTIDTILIPFLDTSEVIPIDGALWVDIYQGCCVGNRGNGNDDPDDKANVADVAYLVDWLFGIPNGPEPNCIEEANANGDPEEKANVADISYLVNWLFGIPSGPPPLPCPGG